MGRGSTRVMNLEIKVYAELELATGQVVFASGIGTFNYNSDNGWGQVSDLQLHRVVIHSSSVDMRGEEIEHGEIDSELMSKIQRELLQCAFEDGERLARKAGILK